MMISSCDNKNEIANIIIATVQCTPGPTEKNGYASKVTFDVAEGTLTTQLAPSLTHSSATYIIAKRKKLDPIHT